MSLNGGKIEASLGLNVAPYTQSMLQASSLAQQFPNVVTSFLANPLLGLTHTLQEVGSIFAATFSSFVNQADDLGDLANSIGVTVENLSALGLVAQQSGGDAQQMADGYRMLGKQIGEALGGSESAMAAFEKLGITIADASGKARPLEAVMMDVADAIKSLPPGAERTAAAMELLGRSGTSLIPTLAQGSAALQEQMKQMAAYGAVTTAESVKSADAWNDAMGEIGIAWEGVKNQLMAPVVSSLLPYIETAVQFVRDNAGQIQSAIGATVEFVGSAFNAMSSVLMPVVGWVQTVAVPAFRDWFAGAIDRSADAVASFQPFLSGLWSLISGGAQLAWSNLKLLFGFLESAWSNVIGPLVEKINSILMPVLSAIGNMVGSVMDKIGSLLSYMGKSVDEANVFAEQVNAIQSPAAAPPPAPIAAAVRPAAQASMAAMLGQQQPATPAVDTFKPIGSFEYKPLTMNVDTSAIVAGMQRSLQQQQAQQFSAGAGSIIAPTNRNAGSQGGASEVRTDRLGVNIGAIKIGDQEAENLTRLFAAEAHGIVDRMMRDYKARFAAGNMIASAANGL